MRDIKVTFTAELPYGGYRSLAAVPSKCTVSRAVCSEDLHHQQSTASLEFPYDPDLFRFLFTGGSLDASKPGKILTAAISDGGETVFTGVPSSRMSWTDLGEPWPADRLSLSLSDGTAALGISAPREMGWINAGISEIVRDICAAAKVSFRAADWQGLPKTTLVIDEGKQLKGVLDEFLLQQGLSYYFGTDGYIRPFRLTLADAPDGELGEHDIVGSPSISQQDRDYTGVKVTYSALTKKSNEQVYFQGSGYKSDNTTAPTVVQPGVYYPFESDPRVEADEGQVYQTFETGYAETYRKYNGETDYRRSAKARLIYTENHKVMPEWEGGIEVERTEFGFRRASVRLVNNGDEDASVYSIAVRADAWYADTEGTVTAGQDGTPYTAECEYVYDHATAERLARLLAKYFVAPCYRMTAQSEKRLALGSLVTFSTGLSGFTKDALVSAAQYDYDKELWTYTLVGYGGAARLDISRAKSQSSNLPALSEIAAVKKQVSQLPGADTTPPSIPVVTSLTGDDYGNALLVFSPSTDTGSGMSHYNVYRRRGSASAPLQIAGTVSHDSAAPQFLWEDATAYKNTRYWYRVTAVDKAGNESAPSALAEFTSTVRISPRPPEDLSSAATEQGIRVAWRPFQSSDAALRAAYHEVELSRDGGATWAAIGRSSERTDYWFDRATDGYPEKSDLAAWRIRVRVVSTYGNTSEYAECAVGTDGYRTWKIGALTAHARAAEKVVTVAWSADGAFYGTLRFDLYKDGEPLAVGVPARSFRDYLDGYPEKSDLAAVTYRVVARTEADTRELDGITPDTSGYLTYKITPPVAAVTADETGLHVSWTGKSGEYYLYPVYDVLVAGKKAAEGITALSLDVPFPEDNRYPLREDVAATEVTVVARTEADTAQSAPATPDVSAFRGWVPPVPVLHCSASGRSVPLSWNAPDVWGFSGCDVQVARAYKAVDGEYVPVTDPAELEWYAPALGKNPYESLDNYRNGDPGGWLSVEGTSVALTVPLWGQQKDADGNVMGAADTLYAYRVRGVTVAYKSEWTEPFFAEARATGAFDVVKAWKLTDTGEKVRLDGALGANQIFVEELAALSANLGLITDGGLFGGKYNYWAVNDTPMPDGSTLWKGSFRVGDEDQYIKATPVLNGDGVPTGRIDLEFRAGQFMINATGTRIDGKSFEVYDDKGGLLFSVSPDGIMTKVDTGIFTSGSYSFDLPGNRCDLDSHEMRMYYPSLTVCGGAACSVYFDFDNYVDFMNSPDIADGMIMGSPFVMRVAETAYGEGGYASNIVMSIPGYFFAPNYIRPDRKSGTVRFIGMVLQDPPYNEDVNEDIAKYGIIDIDLAGRKHHVTELDEEVFGHINSVLSDSGSNSLVFNIENVFFIVYRSGGDNSISSTSANWHIEMLDGAVMTELLSGESERPSAPPFIDGDYIYVLVTYKATVIYRIDRYTLEKKAVRLPLKFRQRNSGFTDFFDKKADGFYIAGDITLFLSATSRKEEGRYIVRIPNGSIDWSDVPADGSTDGIGYAKVEAYSVKDFAPFIDGDHTVEQLVFGDMFVNGFTDDGLVWRYASAVNNTSHTVVAELQRLGMTLAQGDFYYGKEGTASVAEVVSKKELSFGTFEEDMPAEYYDIAWDPLFEMMFGSLHAYKDGYVKNWTNIIDVEESVLRFRLNMNLPKSTEKTGRDVFSSGIGFTEIYHDSTNGSYRYVLGTGAYVEFREDGSLAVSGEKGDPGPTPAISMSATVDGGTGTPSVAVSKSGTSAAPAFKLEFKNLKGAKGDKGDTGSLTASGASDADVADADYAVGTKADGTVTKTLWSKVWAWIKSKVTTASVASEIINACTPGSDIPADTDWVLTQWAKGSTSSPANNTPVRRTFSAVWTWIKGKIEGTTLTNISVSGKITNAGASLNASNKISATNPPRIAAGQIQVHTVYGADAGGPATYGNLINIGGSGGGQVFLEWTGGQTAAGQSVAQGIWYRSMRDNQSGWTAWTKVATLNADGSLTAAAMSSGSISLTNAASSNSATPTGLAYGTMAGNDGWRIAAGGTANNGFLEIATKDDGTEPIKVAQYTGDYANKVREAALLDGSGNTSFPGTLTAGGYQQTRVFVIDTMSLSESMFYPVTFAYSDLMLDCEIHSRSLVGSAAYNQNVLHFQLISHGWSDTPFSLNVLQYGVYDEGEICIGAVGTGQHNGVNCVWVRGGNQYRFVCNRTPTLRTENYTVGDETFTVGVFVDGTGTHANVTVVFDPSNMPEIDAYEVTGAAHAYFSGPIGILPYKKTENGNAVLFGRGKPPRKMVDMYAAAYDELVSGAYVATGSANESGGIIVGGDGIDAWAPPDRNLMRWWNEDNSRPVSAIAGNGAYLGTAESSAYAQVREFTRWVYFDDFVYKVFQNIAAQSEVDVDDFAITDTDYFPQSNLISGINKGGYSGVLGADFKCFVRDSIPGISGYGMFIVETCVVRSENDGDIYGMQIAYAITSSSGRHSYKRCHIGEDGWSSWSSNDL